MPIAFWLDEYCTGNVQVDREHQVLFYIVNSLHEAMMQRATLPIIEDLLRTLATHTIRHFQSEEELMQTHRYPGYDRHKLSHERLKTKVIALVQKFHEQGDGAIDELTGFLAEWLVHHIKGEDQKMIQFFHEQVNRDNTALVASQEV
ncbi:hemerythrin family protein [Oscillatoria sp. FACHB-1407]|uniref:bacteriohemerythrin n=1 Tax=Oscillatoria sp. FACHB-1407 TaxID=2692847 RepID=UPI0016825B55|nr:bacteriohemerythrin [Oscillatoria sp. FACHB-1407]MBD2464850.1 hemerythrin family protein [Oscillatoria sp. FACHB-1407]